MGFSKNSDEINNAEKYAQAMQKFKKLNLAGPFRASHRYVDDRRGDTVLECSSEQIAKVFAELLNCLPNEVKVLEKEVIKEIIKVVEKPQQVEPTQDQKYKKLL